MEQIPIYIILLLNVIVLSSGYLYIFLKGARNHIVFTFSWLIFSVYYFITPLYFYLSGRKTIWGQDVEFMGLGEDISAYYTKGFAYFGLGIFSFLLGYVFINKPSISLNISSRFRNPIALVWIYWFFYSLILINFLIEGINPLAILLGDESGRTLSESGGSNYIKNLSDSLISCVIIASIFKLNKRHLILMILLGSVLFLLMGFRYRIILLFIGIIIPWLYNNRFNFKNAIKLILYFFISFYLILFITFNRFNFVYGKWDELDYQLKEYGIVETLAEQTRGALDDINIIKYYNTNETAQFDYGITFMYFIVRAVPRSLFGEWKDSMYPPPAFKIIHEAYNLPPYWGNTGEAPLFMAYFYIAGGFFGLISLCFLMGLSIGYFTMIGPSHNPRYLSLMCIFCCALFMWYTRGYFPQFLDHLLFLLIPYFLFFKLFKHERA